MEKILKVKFEDLIIIKSYPQILITNKETYDLDGVFSVFGNNNIKKNSSVIIYEVKILKKKLRLTSPKLDIDIDNLKIKIYLKGYVSIVHTSNFSSYYYELDFLD